MSEQNNAIIRVDREWGRQERVKLERGPTSERRERRLRAKCVCWSDIRQTTLLRGGEGESKILKPWTL